MEKKIRECYIRATASPPSALSRSIRSQRESCSEDVETPLTKSRNENERCERPRFRMNKYQDDVWRKQRKWKNYYVQYVGTTVFIISSSKSQKLQIEKFNFKQLVLGCIKNEILKFQTNGSFLQHCSSSTQPFKWHLLSSAMTSFLFFEISLVFVEEKTRSFSKFLKVRFQILPKFCRVSSKFHRYFEPSRIWKSVKERQLSPEIGPSLHEPPAETLKGEKYEQKWTEMEKGGAPHRWRHCQLCS